MSTPQDPYGPPDQPGQQSQPDEPGQAGHGQPGQPAYGQPGQPGQPAYGQPGQPGQPAYGQPYPQQGYGYGQQYPGYAPAARKPFDLAKVVTIAGWVVLGLHALSYLYALTQDQYGEDFGDRLFGNMVTLTQGIFWAGLLLAVGVWLHKQQAER